MAQYVNSLYTFEGQSIHLDSVVNARELGGYVMRDGRRIKKGVLLRGGGLANISDEDIDKLVNKYHLTHVFDLRTEGEVKRAPDRNISRVNHLWLPTIDPETEKFGDATLPQDAYANLPTYLVEHCDEPAVQEVAKKMYTSMITNEYTQLQYAAFLQILATYPGGTFFWHCTQGKDRTGLGSAFLLAALGADNNVIMEDYNISAEYYAEDVRVLTEAAAARGCDEEACKVIVTFAGANSEYFRDACHLIDSQYGGIDNYLRVQMCLGDDDIKALRDKFLED